MDPLGIDFRRFGGTLLQPAGGTNPEPVWDFGYNPALASELLAANLTGIAQNPGQGRPLWSDYRSPSEEDSDNDVFLWDAETKLFGKKKPAWNQSSIGSCVSFGWGRALNDLLLLMAMRGAIQIPTGDVATEPIYGGSRVEIGGGRLGTSDGSIGGWAAQWASRWGVVLRGVYGDIDLCEYSVSRCREYGLRGCPDSLEPIAREHPAKQVALLDDGDALWQALGSAYPVAVCSNLGFDSALKDGYCAQRGTWNHCMEIRGRFINPRRGKSIVWCNSWGDYLNWKDNPNRFIETRNGPVELPPGCFATPLADGHRAMQQQDSYTIGDVIGFPARDMYAW